MSEFSDWLNRAIIAKARALGLKDLTLGQIAERTGIKPPSLSEMRSGKTRKPKYDSCLKLASYFDEDPRQVLKMAGHVVIGPAPIIRTVSLEIESPSLQLHLRRVAELSKAAQDAMCPMLVPIIDHVKQDEERLHLMRKAQSYRVPETSLDPHILEVISHPSVMLMLQSNEQLTPEERAGIAAALTFAKASHGYIEGGTDENERGTWAK